jgi:quercetin dioxygenase-like cupin family protein
LIDADVTKVRQSNNSDLRGRKGRGGVVRVFRSKKRLSVAIVGIVAVGSVAAVALASTGVDFVPSTLVTGTLANRVEANTDQVKFQTKGSTDVRVQKIVFLAGGNSGWHHHPGVVIATVASGAVTFTRNCSSITYGPGLPAGSVFVESGDAPGLASSVAGATAYATFVAPHADPPVFRIEDAGPPTCTPGGDDGDAADNGQSGRSGNSR